MLETARGEGFGPTVRGENPEGIAERRLAEARLAEWKQSALDASRSGTR